MLYPRSAAMAIAAADRRALGTAPTHATQAGR